MKKGLILSSPFSNGGDYLIEKCLKELLSVNRKDIEFVRQDIIKILKHELSFDLTGIDFILIGGGPRLDNRLISSQLLPLFSSEQLNIPVFFLGVGLYSLDKFSKEVMSFLKKCEEMVVGLGVGIFCLQISCVKKD